MPKYYYEIKRVQPKKSKVKDKPSLLREIFFYGLLVLIIAAFGLGWYLNEWSAKRMIKEEISGTIEKNVSDNLSIHLCSTECFYEFEMTKDEYKEKSNDSFLINNKINNSNCGTCFKLNWKEEEQ